MFTGTIPESLGNLPKLVFFNVSSNFLVGAIPKNGSLGNFTSASFTGNVGHCGAQLNKTCASKLSPPALAPAPYCQPPPCTGGILQPTQGAPPRKPVKYLNALLIAVTGVSLLFVIFSFRGYFLVRRSHRNLHCRGLEEVKSSIASEAKLVMFHGDLPYPSKDVVKKIEQLDETDIIGSGGFGTVYRLVMDDGSWFAVKISNNGLGSERLLERELEILGIFKHRNLVNLRGYCNAPSSKLLICDYLPYGSLDEFLHEYMNSGRATEKGDVYSYGVVLLELLSGRRPTDLCFVEKGLNVVGWVGTCIRENRHKEIFDAKCVGVPKESMENVLQIALMCIAADPDTRPSMEQVVQMLESDTFSPRPSDLEYESPNDAESKAVTGDSNV